MLLGQDLDALGCGVCTLVELPGEIFDCEPLFAAPDGELITNGVDLRFRENQAGGGLKLIFLEALEVLALDDAEGFEAFQLQAGLEITIEGTGSGVELGFLFDEETVHEGVLPGLPGSGRD